MSEKVKKRRVAIAKLIEENGTLSSASLAEHFHVSRETIRKDLQILNNEKVVIKKHGGAALPIPDMSAFEGPNMEYLKDEKIAMAREALRLIPQQETNIFIDGGSSAAMVSSLLGSHPGLIVVTPSLLVAHLMRDMPQHKIFLTGGYILQKGQILFNYNMPQILKDFRFSVAILGTAGIKFHNGPTTTEISEFNYKSLVAQLSKKTIVLCDHTKFCNGGIANYLSWSQVDYFICDNQVTPEQLKTINVKNILQAS